MTEALAPVRSFASATVAKIGSCMLARRPTLPVQNSPPFFGCVPGDHLACRIGERLLGVERAGLAGQALQMTLVFASTRMDISGRPRRPPRRSSARRRRGRSAAMTSRPLSFRMRLPSSTLVPSRRTTSGTFRPTSFTAATHALGDHVAAHDAAENVDQDALHLRVGGDDLEGRRHLLLARRRRRRRGSSPAPRRRA